MYLVQNTRAVNIEYVYAEHADITIGFKLENDINLSLDFYNKMSLSIYDSSLYFEDELLIRNDQNEPDYISTAIYLANCVQEYSKEYLDQYGRYDHSASLQEKFDNYDENYVVHLIDKFLDQCNIKANSKPSQIYISHDVDFLTSGLKQEFIYAIKQGQLKHAGGLISQRLSGGSPWNNIKAVVDLDKSLNVDSCFYWLNNTKSLGGINNADYILDQADLDLVEESGLTNGLHKSVSAVNIFRECDDFPINVLHNRYHYLKFTLPEAWQDLEHKKATIKTDASLGLPRKIGFRNSYGLPFYPYNFQSERPFDTLIFPLQIMDVALQSHGSQNRHDVVEEVMNFINKNKTDSVISLLFHNNELTSGSNNYMLEAYKDIIDIISESELQIKGIDSLYNDFK